MGLVLSTQMEKAGWCGGVLLHVGIAKLVVREVDRSGWIAGSGGGRLAAVLFFNKCLKRRSDVLSIHVAQRGGACAAE